MRLTRLGLGLLAVAGLAQIMFGIAALVLIASGLTKADLLVISGLLAAVLLAVVLVHWSTRRRTEAD